MVPVPAWLLNYQDIQTQVQTEMLIISFSLFVSPACSVNYIAINSCQSSLDSFTSARMSVLSVVE